MTWKKEYNHQRQAYLAQKQRQRRQKIKEQVTKQVAAQLAKYYQAHSIRVLMNLKEYTELNKEKRKLWVDFNWTLKDCAEDIHDIEAIMKLREVADLLIKDYWETAKREIKKGQNWNNLNQQQQAKLIKYWGREKARIENGYIDTAERLEKQGQEYEKDIELAKFHEERGKFKCQCYQCAESKKIQTQIQKEFYGDKSEEPTQKVKSECGNCYQHKKVDPESGLCKKCSADYD